MVSVTYEEDKVTFGDQMFNCELVLYILCPFSLCVCWMDLLFVLVYLSIIILWIYVIQLPRQQQKLSEYRHMRLDVISEL